MLETQNPIQSAISAGITAEDSSLIEKAATTEQGVLITGENGTGKEIIARIIHNRSLRSGKTFSVINCSLSGEVLESEFQAKMETTAGGTVYFEEINELPLHLQGRLVQNNFTVRIIASSSASLQALVAEKLFRSDLFAKFVAARVDSLCDSVVRRRRHARDIFNFHRDGFSTGLSHDVGGGKHSQRLFSRGSRLRSARTRIAF